MKTCLLFLFLLWTGRQSPVAFSNIQFNLDNSEISADNKPSLALTAAALKTSGKHCVISGHAAHGEGTASHNQRLSKDRAQAVLEYLLNAGVNKTQLSIKFYGETRPIADNSTENGRALNRRVEFQVSP